MAKGYGYTRYQKRSFESAYDSYRERYKDRAAKLYEELEKAEGRELFRIANEYLSPERIREAIARGEKAGAHTCRSNCRAQVGEWPELETYAECYEKCIQRYREEKLRIAIRSSPLWRQMVDESIGIPSKPTMGRWWQEYWRCSRGQSRDSYRLSHDEFEEFLEVEFGYIHPYHRKKPGRRKGSKSPAPSPHPTPRKGSAHRGKGSASGEGDWEMSSWG